MRFLRDPLEQMRHILGLNFLGLYGWFMGCFFSLWTPETDLPY